MRKISFISLGWHLLAIAVFYILTLIFFYPLTQQKVLKQHDKVQTKGMNHEILEFRKAHHKDPLWTSTLFSGMPTFQITTSYPNNVVVYIERIVKLKLPSQTGLIFSMMLGFYLLMILLGVNRWLSIIGAISFALSTYFIVSFDVGHTGKLRVIGYMAPTILGVLMAYRGKYLVGAGITAISVALAVHANHFQIVYFLLFILLIIIL
ncbi:MAG: hypothetical protein IIA45_14875, partial [Bacteroidetes bacterium]|nr:hypothetical protein [Bacteroidota bacterium]